MVDITMEKLWEISKIYNMKEAAAYFNVGTTKFKKVCRDRGIKSWPYRRFQSFHKMLASPVFSDADKEKLRVILDASVRHQFQFRADQKFILDRARHKCYKHNARAYQD